jgi:Telomere resolvase
MTSSPSIWIDTAAAHGSTSWVRQFIRKYLPPLAEQSLSTDGFVAVWEDQLRSRQLDTPIKQKNYRSNLVQAIKSFSPSHPAIALIALSSEQYRDLNNQQRGKLADRETRYFTNEQAEQLVKHATSLLDSAEWSEVGAGLAVLIGRRISEILLSQFAPKSDWSIIFSEMSKKKDSEGLTIEIPTLAPATTVLRAIDRLHKHLRIDDLKLNSLSPKMAKQTVNSRFSSPIASRCVEHFSQLIPPRSDKDNLYTHIFRAVYATIAAHWFCPPYIPEHSFKAEIQGHYSIASNGTKLPNFSARANYDDYAIGTEDGNRDGRLGIKLGQLSNLQIIDAFRKSSPDTLIHIGKNDQKDMDMDMDMDMEEGQSGDRAPISLPVSSQLNPNFSATFTPPNTMHPTNPKALTKRTEIFVDDLEEITRFMAKQGVTGKHKDIFHALVQTLDSIQADYLKHNQAHTQLASEFTANMHWFTSRIDSLEQSCQQLRDENEQLKHDCQQLQQNNATLKNTQTSSGKINQLEAENQQLKQQLLDTKTRLEGIQKLLGLPQAIASTQQQHQETVEPPQAAPKRPKPKKPDNLPQKGDTLQKIHQIIDAMIAWNTSQELSMNQLRISIPMIKVLANAIGANYQPAIQQVLKERELELDELHNRLMLGTRHNATVRKEQILKKIQQQYLGINPTQE